MFVRSKGGGTVKDADRRKARRRVNAWQARVKQLDAELAEVDGFDKPTDEQIQMREHRINVGKNGAAARWAKTDGKYRASEGLK